MARLLQDGTPYGMVVGFIAYALIWVCIHSVRSFSQPVQPASIPSSLEFVVITDLDHDSKIKEAADKGKPRWKSYFKKGVLNFDKTAGSFSVEWSEAIPLNTGVREV